MLHVLLLAEVVAFSASTLTARQDFDPLLDGWLKGAAYVTCAVVATIGAVTAVRDRRLWSFVAAAVGLRALGFVVHLGFIRHLDPVPAPSLADVAWLAMYGPMAAALVLLTRRHFSGITAVAILEASAGMLGSAAFLFIVLPDVLDSSSTATLRVVTQAMYPVLDTVLLVLTIAVLTAYRGRAPAAVWLLAVGVTAFAAVDTVFLYQLTHGGHRSATPLSALSLVATAIVALTARLPLAETDPTTRVAGFAVPRIISGACIVLLGVARWVDVPTVSVVLAVAGILLALAAVQVTHDRYLTSLEEATAALRASERQLTEAQQLSHVGSVELSLPDQTVTWSPQMYRLLGLDATTRPSLDALVAALHPDDFDAVASAWADLNQRGQQFSMTYRVRRTDGEVRWIRGRGIPRFDERGKMTGSTGTFLDDTERVVAERALRSAERRFVVGFEHGRIAAAMFDLSGKPREVNHAMCDFLQRTREALLTTRWIEFSHPDEPPLADQILGELRSGIDHYQGERRFLRPDGSVVWAAGHLTLMRDEDGQPDYLLAQLADITALKVLEGERLQHQRRHAELVGRLAVAEDLERDRIARDIHDDTIQRMAASSMLLERIRRGLETDRIDRTETVAQLADAAEAVMDATERIRDVVYNLATPDVGDRVVDATRSLADWLFSGTDTRAEVVGEPGPLDPAMTQATHRIVAEALRNVRRHANASSVVIRFARVGDQVMVSVADDGVGVPPGGPAPTPRHFGVKTMTERAGAMGGSCTVEPGDSGGTVVTLQFSARRAALRR